MTTQDKIDIFWLLVKFFIPTKTASRDILHAIQEFLATQLVKMSSFWWTLLAALAAVTGPAKCETTAFPVIPKHLLDCYVDPGTYHRANRMPNSLDSFFDLVRKVEGGSTSRNMNARELALALLQYLKLDGIQSVQSHTKYFPSDVLPFSPSGAEYFKHRLTVVGLVPKIDPGYMAAINETLGKKEMCNLHFMLSYSIDPYKRDDERCSPLFEGSGKEAAAESGSAWDRYRSAGGHRGRRRRRVLHGERFNGLGATDETVFPAERSFGKADAVEKHERRISKRPTETPKSESEMLSRRRKSVSDGERGKKSEAEEIPALQRQKARGAPVRGEKDRFTIGDQELLSAGEFRPEAGMQSLVHARGFKTFGGRPHDFTHSADENLYTGVIPGIPLSDCPVVNGIIATPFGSLAAGTVVAGIAAGLNPEDIPPVKFSVDPAELESPSDRVKNIWATTLAGTVADVIASSAILDADSLQILKGGWNDSSDHKWYLLDNNQFAHLPEVALRGSLDGFLLGVNAKEWSGKFQGLKLSQMLQMYYNGGWEGVGAKNRVELRPRYAPDEVFRKQVRLMSLVLKKQKTNYLTVLNYDQIAAEAVKKVTRHIGSMDYNGNSDIGSFPSTKIDNFINMIVVIDSSWGFESLQRIFETLRSAQVVNTVGKRLTVVCGKDGKVLTSTDNSADFYSAFTKQMLLDNCTRGLDIPLAIDSLDTAYRKIFYDEKTSGKMNPDAEVAVLFPYEPLSRENYYVTEKCNNFKRNFPDVRLMIVANGRAEGFLPLVRNPNDLLALLPHSSDPNSQCVKEFAEEVKQSHGRISRPSCGSYFDDQGPGTETHVTRDVGSGYVVYYRLSPQYFYTQSGQATVTIKSKTKTPLTVCHSREMERPAGPTPRGGSGSDHYPGRIPDYGPGFPPEASPYGRQTNERDAEGRVQCKTISSEPYVIEMNNPCEGASNLQECRPLYVSMTAPHRETVSIFCSSCRLPTNVEYEISVNGLTCYNNAAAKFLSPLLFSLLLIHYSLKHCF